MSMSQLRMVNTIQQQPPPPKISILPNLWVIIPIVAVVVAIISANLLLLNYIHVFTAILWTGTDIFMAFLLGPVLRNVSLATRKDLWPKVLQLTKKLYDNGVTILSGSDIPNFDLAPGASLHHELELLVEAGISPLEVIKIATRNGAQALSIEEDVGTVEPGKQADMIILSDNPVDNINNIKKIEAVINNGHFIKR
jgi:imidazolonepropionase-like amidohydrolase